MNREEIIPRYCLTREELIEQIPVEKYVLTAAKNTYELLINGVPVDRDDIKFYYL